MIETVVSSHVQQAAQFLAAGELVAIPTETVYGLAANAKDEAAVAKVYTTKGRPSFNPLIVHVANAEVAKSYASEWPAWAQALAYHFWPGPLTILVPKAATISDVVTAGSPRVALRVPNHPLTLELLSQLDFPLVAPSANPFGYVSPTTAEHVLAQFNQHIAMVLDGGSCDTGIESTIVGEQDSQVVYYRAGGLPIEAIAEVLGYPIKEAKKQTQSVETPGMLPSHYAPSKPFYLDSEVALLMDYHRRDVGVLAFYEPLLGYPEEQQLVLSPEADLSEAAHKLFGALRLLDQMPNVKAIFANSFPNSGLGIAINDRLQRAAADTDWL